MKSKRGFASMTPEKQRAIASKGGKTAHTRGTAHKWTSDEAQEAGKRGGKIRAENAKKRKEEATDE